MPESRASEKYRERMARLRRRCNCNERNIEACARTRRDQVAVRRPAPARNLLKCHPAGAHEHEGSVGGRRRGAMTLALPFVRDGPRFAKYPPRNDGPRS